MFLSDAYKTKRLTALNEAKTIKSASVLKAANTLGMPEATLHSWVQKAKRSG